MMSKEFGAGCRVPEGGFKILEADECFPVAGTHDIVYFVNAKNKSKVIPLQKKVSNICPLVNCCNCKNVLGSVVYTMINVPNRSLKLFCSKKCKSDYIEGDNFDE